MVIDRKCTIGLLSVGQRLGRMMICLNSVFSYNAHIACHRPMGAHASRLSKSGTASLDGPLTETMLGDGCQRRSTSIRRPSLTIRVASEGPIPADTGRER